MEQTACAESQPTLPAGEVQVANGCRLPTLVDLEREGRPLQIWCNRCKRRVERDALTLRLLLGAEQPIYGVWTRLWCVECGARGRGSHGEVYSMPLGPKNETSAVALEERTDFRVPV